MVLVEDFKEGIKYSLKEIQENTAKQVEVLKELQANTAKQIEETQKPLKELHKHKIFSRNYRRTLLNRYKSLKKKHKIP